MNSSQLECFVSLAGTLNFVKTAEQLGLSQPAVSKQIKSMEEELGAPLFFRTSRSVTLTPAGIRFLPEAADMLSIYYRSKQRIRAFSGESHHPLRIGYSDPLLMRIFHELLREYLASYPDLPVAPELVCDQTDANLSRLQSGQLDLILGIRDAAFDDADIVFTKLMQTGFVCGISRSHPLAEKYLRDPSLPRVVSSEQMWGYRQILAIPPYLLRKQFSRGHRILPVNDEVDNICCANTNEAYALFLSGIGYALIPECLKVDHPDALFLSWQETPHAPYGIYHRRHEKSDPALTAFIRTARQHYGSDPSALARRKKES